MLGLLSFEEYSSLPVLVLSDDVPPILPASPRSEDGRGCHGCDAYRPDPQLSGNLQIDPEIHLPSPGMDVDIAYFYNATSPANGPFGYGRTLSTNLTAQASGSPLLVTMTRGDGSMATFTESGVGTGVFSCATMGSSPASPRTPPTASGRRPT